MANCNQLTPLPFKGLTAKFQPEHLSHLLAVVQFPQTLGEPQSC